MSQQILFLPRHFCKSINDLEKKEVHFLLGGGGGNQVRRYLQGIATSHAKSYSMHLTLYLDVHFDVHGTHHQAVEFEAYNFFKKLDSPL